MPLLSLLDELVESAEIELLVPEVVRDEFARNRARVLTPAKASQADVLKRARNVLRQFGEADRKDESLLALDDVAHKVAIHGEASNESMSLVEKLLEGPASIAASIIARQRAANRGLERLAPCARHERLWGPHLSLAPVRRRERPGPDLRRVASSIRKPPAAEPPR